MSDLLDSRQLAAFCALAREGSCTGAGRELGLTQSAVSHSIKALETDLGCALFARVGKKMLLTREGRMLLGHAEALLQAMRNARLQIQGAAQVAVGAMRVGCSTTGSIHLLPPVLREFRECFPRFNVEVEPCNTAEAVRLLQESRIDLALCVRPESGEGLAFRPLFRDELVCVVSPMHALAGRKRIAAKDLEGQQFLLYERKSRTFELVLGHFAAMGLRPRQYIEMGSFEAILELAKLGMGVAVAPEWLAAKDLGSGALVVLPLGRKRPSREWVVASLAGRNLRLAEETFVGLCEQIGAQFGER